MRIVQLNLAYDRALATPQHLLGRYHTLTGWSRALASAGASVAVVQRFSSTHDITEVPEPVRSEEARRSSADAPPATISYSFVTDQHPDLLPAWSVATQCIDTVAQLSPDVVHVNGLMFPAMTVALRGRLPDGCVIVLQDHSGIVPGGRGRTWITKRKWERAFRAADACLFTAREIATRWERVGLPHDMSILEIPEASTTLLPIVRKDALRRSGITGTPAILWVGRADANKDPSTVLKGFVRAMNDLPNARLWMVLPDGSSSAIVSALLKTVPQLHDRVAILGPIPYDLMPYYYSSADIFISGSHHEGSGYALLEALACGAVPCVTDIPAFRVLASTCGVLWRVGDADACADALREAARRVWLDRRDVVVTHFARQLSWAAIAHRTFDAYGTLLERRRHRS